MSAEPTEHQAPGIVDQRVRGSWAPRRRFSWLGLGAEFSSLISCFYLVLVFTCMVYVYIYNYDD